MKTNQLFILVFFLVFSIHSIFAQQWSCGGGDITGGTANHLFTNHICTSNSIDNPSYIPRQNSDLDIKYVRVNVHIMQKVGTNAENFEDTPEHRIIINKIVNYYTNNNTLVPINAPTLGGQPTGDPFIEDSKIRFDFDINSDLYFWQDDTGWNNNDRVCGSYSFDNYKVDEDCAINIFFCENINDPTWGTGVAGCGPGNFVVLNNVFRDNQQGEGEWSTAGLLVHEVGHCLDIHHCWQTNQTNLFSDLYAGHTIQWCNQTAADPNCSNNVMGYSGSLSWLSPLQIAHMHRLLLGSWRSKFLKVEYNQSMSITIDSDETWDIGKLIYGDVTIESGASLTISCKVIMPPSGRIIVKPGGNLIVDDGLITVASKLCDENEKWGGIVVEGNPNVSNSSSNGVVTINNNSIIEHALVAVDVEPGGLLFADNATFSNNRRGVNVRDNKKFHTIDFENCTFTWDDNYIPDVPISPKFQSHVYLNNAKGIQFRRCTFENLRTGLPSINRYGRGILAYNSGFDVRGLCPELIPQGECPSELLSHFKSLYKGIDAKNTNSMQSFAVKDSEFNQNNIGIYLNAVDLVSMRRCYFNVGTAPNHPGGFVVNEGISVVESEGYTITENVFTATGGGLTIGNRIFNTNSDGSNTATFVECNEHIGLALASLSNGNNRGGNASPTIERGLNYLINDYEGNRYAIAATGENNDGISAEQGHLLVSSGNLFRGNSVYDVYYGVSNNVLYWYGPDNPQEKPIKYFGIDIDKSDRSSYCVGDIILPPDCEDQFGDPSGGIGDIYTTTQGTYDCVRSRIDDADALLLQANNKKEIERIQLEIQALEVKLSKLINTALFFILTDESTNQIDYTELRKWLELKGGIKSVFAIVESYIAEGRNQKALNYLQRKIEESTEDDRASYQRFYMLKQMAILYSNSWEDLTVTQIAQIRDLANNNEGRAAAQARAILETYFEEDHFISAVLPEIDGLDNGQFEDPQFRMTQAEESFKLFPNPANKEVNISVQLESYTKVNIIFYNVQGQLVQQHRLSTLSGQEILDISEFKEGLYFYQVVCDDTVCENGKLFVTK